MPEGDTIFRAARTLHRALAGHVVTRFDTQYAHLARVHDDHPITGRSVERVEARGKHLLMHFGALPDRPGVVLRTHMRMSGSWHIYRVGEPWQRSPRSARIVVATDEYVAVAFAVPVAEFVPARDLHADEALARLGPDVLGEPFDEARAVANLAVSPQPTAAEALLDQTAVAGIGNVYKSELLFLAGVHPLTTPALVAPARWLTMMRDARRLLRVNVLDPGTAGTAAVRGTRRTTGRSNPAERLYVYGREGQPCRRCGTVIEGRHHGVHNRSTYWCPRCQA